MRTALMMIAMVVVGLIMGIILQSMATASRISHMQEELDHAIPAKDILYFLHDRIQPRYMKDSISWNAALYDVEEWVKKRA